MYGPAIESSEVSENFTTDTLEARLLENVKSIGTIQYLYVLEVYRLGETNACTFITSEVNAMAQVFGGGSHFLCAFADGSHLNFGSSDTWADKENFKERALAMAKEYVKKGSFDA